MGHDSVYNNINGQDNVANIQDYMSQAMCLQTLLIAALSSGRFSRKENSPHLNVGVESKQ